MTKLNTRQEEIRVLRKQLALARNYLLFWDSNIFWRSIYNRILKHKFRPINILHRYEMQKERKIVNLVNIKTLLRSDKNH